VGPQGPEDLLRAPYEAATERRRTSEALLELRSHHRSRGARNLLSMLERRRRNWPIAGAIDHLRDPEASRPQMVMWSSPVS